MATMTQKTVPVAEYRELLSLAHSAVSYVGTANYPEREIEAHQWLNEKADRALNPPPEVIQCEPEEETG